MIQWTWHWNLIRINSYNLELQELQAAPPIPLVVIGVKYVSQFYECGHKCERAYEA